MEIVNLPELAKQSDWNLLLYPDPEDRTHYHLLVTSTPGAEINAITTSCLVLLGRIRDEHPNEEIADKAAEMLVNLNTWSRTVK
jgi:hypothetical protein